MKTVSLLYALFLLCGCETIRRATTTNMNEPDVYYHDTKNSDEFYEDQTDCEVKFGQAHPRASGIFGQQAADNFFERCMRGKGWRK